MKKLVEMVKMFILSMVVAVMMIPEMTCQADYYSRPVTELAPMIGTWYDVNGNVALTIGSDYSINGCKIVAFYLNGDYNPMFFGNGVYVCRINEGNRTRDIIIDYNSMPSVFSSNDYHEMIILNGQTMLRRTKNPRYFESIGGVYIGMSKNQVASLYGQPTSIGRNYGCVTTWKYSKEGFDVNFAGDGVVSITIYPTGNRRFDWSGLSANNSINDFKYKYNSREGQVRHIQIIGYGESIRFNGNAVTLSTDF